MKLQDQVCTLSQGKQLKALGVPISSNFVHIDNLHKDIGYEGLRPTLHQRTIDGGVIRYYPAFTSSELSELLPPHVDTWKTHDGRHYNCRLCDASGKVSFFSETTEAVSNASLLINLIFNKLISLDDVLKRLETP